MILSWRRRRAGRRANKNNNLNDDEDGNLDMELSIPTHFRCPISLDLMKDPVTLSTGITYDRDSIEKWIESGNQTCPVSNQVLRTFDQIPNHAIRKMIQDWCVDNRSRGIERIPTPRVPVAPYEVSDTCRKITAATQRGDHKKCLELVAKVRTWGRESDRNKRCVVDNGTGCVLSASFESFAKSAANLDEHVILLQEITSVLTWMFPLGSEGQCKLGSEASLRRMVWLLKNGDLSARRNTATVLKELLSLNQTHVHALAKIEGVAESLVKIVKEPICPTSTKASLMIIFYMVSSEDKIVISRFVELRLVQLLLEILVDGDKATSEKALGILDGLCEGEEGREKAYGHALAVPILVKKVLRVSELATEFAVSVLWKLCKNNKEVRRDVVVAAVQAGAFQKILVLLQVGCGEGIREKATNLLKLLNLYKNEAECVDSSMDFKYLKRSS